ncbi:Clp protease N-terminal domain-containing protein [Xylanimonas ulmi]|uniref:Clp protease N-terminal domain-containing protein n=1 Tax=Xylanimonas ulmi TaxID=228973 RepID=UPI00102BFACA|nr:Clp protease N-terminal domain-containing protein [Xylanibacterium ulmi]
MFERFTKDAREAVVDAQVVARSTHSRTIDARHVLVALVEPGAGPACDALDAVGLDAAALARALRDELGGAGLDGEALAAIGVDLDAVRRATDATFGEGSLDGGGLLRRDRKHIPFTADAKKALELALREAIRLGSAGIDGGHLLLGILRGGSPAASALRAALAQAGSDDAALRAAVERRRDAA